MRTIFIDLQRYYVPDDTFQTNRPMWHLADITRRIRSTLSYVLRCDALQAGKHSHTFWRNLLLIVQYPASNRNIRQVPPDYSTQHPVVIFLLVIMNIWGGGGEGRELQPWFCRRNVKERDHLEDHHDVKWRIILILVLQEYGRVWSGLIWLWTGKSGRISWPG